MSHPLRLHHELLLLALHDDKGTVQVSGMLDLGIAGALFCELIFEERVELRPEGRRGRPLTTVLSRATFGDEVLDEALRRLIDAKRRANPQNTVISLSRMKKLRARTAVALCRRGILRESEDRVLWLFRRRIYPTVDPKPEAALIDRIRTAIEQPEVEVEPRTALLVTLANLVGALRPIYSRKELRTHKARLKQLKSLGGAGSEATHKAIEAAQAAMAAGVAASAAATSAST